MHVNECLNQILGSNFNANLTTAMQQAAAGEKHKMMEFC